MIVKSIYLENFRNYKAQEIKLENNINVFYGNNAQGKTNILEALYFCAFGRSFRTHKDAELICFNNENAKIVVEFNILKCNVSCDICRIFIFSSFLKECVWFSFLPFWSALLWTNKSHGKRRFSEEFP